MPPEYSRFNLVYSEAKAIYEGDKAGGVRAAVKKELGSICGRILQNTAVFKDKQQTVKFMQELGFRVI